MRKKIIVLTIGLLFLLSGCQTVMETAGTIVEKIGGYEEKPESEYIEFLETIPIGKGKLELVSEEYTGISGYTLQNTLGGNLYQWTNPGEAEHYSVLSFYEISDCPVELCLPEELTSKSAKLGSTVVLSNDADTRRLYVAPLNGKVVTAEQVENSTKLDWIQEQSHNLVYQGGYFAKEQTEEGWQVIYEVENLGWQGYVVKKFDFKNGYIFLNIMSDHDLHR